MYVPYHMFAAKICFVQCRQMSEQYLVEAKLRMRKNEAALFVINEVAREPRMYFVAYFRKLFRVREAWVPPKVTI